MKAANNNNNNHDNNNRCYGFVNDGDHAAQRESSVIISLPAVKMASSSKNTPTTPTTTTTKAFERSGIYRESFAKVKTSSASSSSVRKVKCQHQPHSQSKLETLCEECARIYNDNSRQRMNLTNLMNIREQDDAKVKERQQRKNIVFAEPQLELEDHQQHDDNTLEYESLVSKLRAEEPGPSCAKDAFGPEQLELLEIKPLELTHNELVHHYGRLQQLCKIKFDRIYEVVQQQQQEKLLQQQQQAEQQQQQLEQSSQDRKPGTLIKKKKKYKPYHVSDESAIQKNTRIFRVFPEFMDALQNDSWPESTEIACWWDCHPFEGQPVPMPVRYRPRTNDFKVIGCFCSWNCVMAYNRAQQRPVCSSLIGFMYRRVTQSKRSRIKPAMPRESLRIFGGPLTIEEFRSKSVDPRLTHCLLTAPMTMLRTEVQEVETERRQADFAETIKKAIAAADAEQQKFKKTTTTTSTASAGTAAAAGSRRRSRAAGTRAGATAGTTTRAKPSKLRLRRKKPLPNEGNTLFSTMGLKIIEKN
jgi:hypothetical protein